MTEDQLNVSHTLGRLEAGQEGMKQEMRDFIRAADNRFASKWVQHVVAGLVSMVCLAVIGAILALVLAPEPVQTPAQPTKRASFAVISPDNGVFHGSDEKQAPQSVSKVPVSRQMAQGTSDGGSVDTPGVPAAPQVASNLVCTAYWALPVAPDRINLPTCS